MEKKGIQVNEISEKTKASFKVRLITAIILIAVCVPCIIFGNWFFAGLGVLVSVTATYEFIHVLSGQKHFKWIDIITFIMTLTFIYWVMFKTQYKATGHIIDSSGNINISDIGVSTLGMAFLLCVLFLGSMMTSKFNVPDVCYFFTMSLVISLGVQSLHFLRYVPLSGVGTVEAYHYDNNLASCLLFVYFLLGTCMSDIGAYAIGILFGKHKMNPRISPNKTWEGFAGGIAFSFVFSFVFGLLVSINGNPLIGGVLDAEHWYWILLISLVMPIASVIGDFIFSAIKRHYGIKDFSNILPGHGGVLDRIDSILINGIVVTIIILSISNFPFI